VDVQTIRRVLFLLLVLIGLEGAASFQGFATVFATTGPSDVPARYKVPHAIAALYPGQYALRTVASDARISHAQMIIDFNSLEYLAGVAQFSGYDAQGHQTTWVADMYNFHLTAAGMVVPLLGPANAVQLGTMYLHHAKSGDLVGQIALPTRRYSISWHKTLSL
jgi:hypothetical protein